MSLDSTHDLFTHWTRKHGHTLLRYGLGLVFVWFGAPKLVPGLSPAEGLVAATVPWFDASWFVPVLGLAECLIGVCLWRRRLMPLGLVLMAGHMVGAALPLFTLPEIAWKSFPVATLEGQYILKNMVLIASAIVLAGQAAPRRARARKLRREWMWPSVIPTPRASAVTIRCLSSNPAGARREVRSLLSAAPERG